MSKWLVLAASCVACTAAFAQESNEPVVSTDEIVIDQTQVSDDANLPPSLEKDGKGCGCGGGKKTK